jgi:enediyne biosynthesis thioesterase
MAIKTFVFNKRVYLGDTNLVGNVYFANYFYWQGMAREEFFRQLISDPMFFIKKEIKLVTLEANIRFKKEALLFDEIEIRIKPENVKFATFDIVFTFVNKNTGEILAEGKQKIGFVDKDNKVVPIPKELVSKGVEYL